MKLKPKTTLKSPRTERVKLEGECAALLDDYARFYESTYGQAIVPADLLAEIAASFIKADREFIRWRAQPQPT